VDRDRDILDKGSMRPARPCGSFRLQSQCVARGGGARGLCYPACGRKGDRIKADVVFFDTPEGRKCCERVQREAPDWSFGLRNIETRPLTDDERRRGALRAIRRFELYEVSPVVKGASVASGTAHACCGSCATGAGKCSTTPEEPKDSPDFEFFPEWQRDLLEKVRGRVKLAKVNEAVEMNRGRQLLQEIKASLARIEGDL
jgi:hypothetical protein